MLRTAARISHSYKEAGILRAHQTLLIQLHAWAATIVGFNMPNALGISAARQVGTPGEEPLCSCFGASDTGATFALRACSGACLRCNVVSVSDGATRESSGRSAAARAAFSVTTSIRLMAAGALLLPEGSDSMHAETTVLELAVAAVLKLSK